jgi:hypothetical protein
VGHRQDVSGSVGQSERAADDGGSRLIVAGWAPAFFRSAVYVRSCVVVTSEIR